MNGGEATTLETQLRASIPGIAKLEYALKTAIAAAAGAEKFGHAIGYAVRFAPYDIRAMAITVFGETRKPAGNGCGAMRDICEGMKGQPWKFNFEKQ